MITYLINYFSASEKIPDRLSKILILVLIIMLGMVAFLGIYLLFRLITPEASSGDLIPSEIFIAWLITFLFMVLFAVGLSYVLRKSEILNRKIVADDKSELFNSKMKYKIVIDHIPVAIVQYDKNLLITEYNKEFADLIHTERTDLTGESLHSIFNRDFTEIFQKSVYGSEKTFEGWFKIPGRTITRFILINAAPIPDSNNQTRFGVAIIQDITHRKNSENDLVKASRYYKLSSKSNSSLLKSKTEYELIQNICSVFVDAGGYAAASVAYINDLNKTEFRRVYSKGDSQIDLLFSDKFNLIRKRHSPFVTAAKLNKPITFYPDELFEDESKEFGINKTIVVPLDGSGTAFGLLVLQIDKSMKVDSEEFGLINEIAGDLAFGISKFEMESRHSTVRNVLFETEEKFKKLIGSTDDIIFTLDKQKKFDGIFGRWIDSSGIDPRLFLNKNPIEVFGEQDGKVHNVAADKAIDGENVTYEWDYPGDSRRYYFITTLSAIYDENGNASGLVGVTKNITDLKESTLALEREYQRTKIYLEATSDGFVMFNDENQIQENNKSFSKLVSMDNAAIRSKKICDFISNYDSDEFNKRKSSLRSGQSFVIETELLRNNSLPIPVEIITTRIEFSGSQAFVSSVRDLSTRKESEEQLRLLSKAIENSPAGVVITEADASIIYVNKRYEEITGYSSEEMLGKNPKILKPDSISSEVYTDLWKNLTAGKEWDGELLNKKKSGELYWEKALISPMIDAKGRTTHYVAIKEDISQRKEMERMLVEAKEKAEEMNRLKSNFLANMSHELRTPMIGILGYSELLKSELNDNPELLELASVINRAGNRLMETLNLILDLSRIESGNLEINIDLVELNSLVSECIQLFEENAKQKNLFIKNHFTANHITTSTDARLLTLAVNNLINNAIKFTNSGGITVEVKTFSQSSKDFAVISVQDTGIGIPEDKQSIIFDEFRQVSEGYSRSFEGTGLGLTLTKKAIEILNGSISLISESGKGSTFSITIPLRVELSASLIKEHYFQKQS